MNWLVKAKALKCGHKTKIPHCSTDRSMMINHTVKGYSGHCFRCKESVFEPHGQRSIAELRKQRAELYELTRSTTERKLPDDFTDNVPDMHRVWWLRCGIPDHIIASYLFGYSPKHERIIIPFYDNEEKLIGFSARRTENGHGPKYINSKGSLDSYLFYSKPRRDDGTIVVTEDVLSAIKVGLVADACALVGTATGSGKLVQLSKYQRVYVWLDPDKAGQRASTRLLDALIMMGVECYTITSNQDPKYHSRKEIREYIDKAKRYN